MSKEVKRYMEVFNEIKESINSLKGAKFIDNYKKTLFFSLIDLMSKAVYGKKYKTNRERFVNFIYEFASWKHGRHVSLPQLILVAENDESGKLEKVREYAEQYIEKWHKKGPVPIMLDNDPHENEVYEVWPCEANKGITVEHLNHANLLWKLRNSLIHEMRIPGRYVDLFEEKQPHYISMGKIYSDGKDGIIMNDHESWELIHPIPFYINIIEKGMKNIENYLIENKINPYENFKFDPFMENPGKRN